MKKVLIVDNSIAVTGAFKSITNVAKELRGEFDFYFATNGDIEMGFNLPHRRKRIFRFIEISRRIEVLLYPFYLLFNSFKLLFWIKKEKIDVIHVNDLYNLVGVLVKFFSPKTRLIYHVRLLPDSYLKKYYGFLSRIVVFWADYIICVSDAVYKSIPASDKKQIIYNTMQPPVDADSERHDRKEVRFLYPSNYIKGKGHELALESFLRALDSNPNMQLRFMGSDMGLKKNSEFKMKLEKRVNLLKGKEGNVQFHDFAKDLAQEIRNSDVVLMFSESESFSRICLEASFEGRPVIATKCGGSEEIVVHGKTGLLVENLSVEQMRNAILEISKSRNLRMFLGKNALSRSNSKFNIKNIVKQYHNIYCN